MKPITLHPDKFGFYQSGPFKSYRKIEAIEAHARTGHFVQWDFNRCVFDHQDWLTEPSEPLWQMYLERAQQIRQTYDYCVLFYSGGSDSDNMLRAWLAAGCKLDEIASFNLNSTNGAKGNFDWALETDLVVRPTVDELKQQGLDFVYRELDSVTLCMDYIKQAINDYYYQANHSFSPNNMMKSVLRERIPHYQDLIAAGKKLCFVWGSEKPQLHHDRDTGRWYFDFLDIIDNCVSPATQERFNQGWYDELFYWTPDYPEIPIKQAHTLRRFCLQSRDTQWFQSQPNANGFNPHLKKYLTTDALKLIIYPRWDSMTFVARKPKFGAVKENFGFLAFSERDHWFFASNTELCSSYEQQIKSLYHNLSNHNRYDWAPAVEQRSRSIITANRQRYQFS